MRSIFDLFKILFENILFYGFNNKMPKQIKYNSIWRYADIYFTFDDQVAKGKMYTFDFDGKEIFIVASDKIEDKSKDTALIGIFKNKPNLNSNKFDWKSNEKKIIFELRLNSYLKFDQYKGKDYYGIANPWTRKKLETEIPEIDDFISLLEKKIQSMFIDKKFKWITNYSKNKNKNYK